MSSENFASRRRQKFACFLEISAFFAQDDQFSTVPRPFRAAPSCLQLPHNGLRQTAHACRSVADFEQEESTCRRRAGHQRPIAGTENRRDRFGWQAMPADGNHQRHHRANHVPQKT